MSHSHDHSHHVDTSTPRGKKQARALKAVLAINSVMVAVEGVTGYLAHSTAMVADTLDMLGDALGAASGLAVHKRSRRWQAGAALAKAGLMGALGVGVLAGAALAIFNPVMPVVATMGVVGGLAFAANAACVGLLWRYRNDNINIKSTMACSRNDMISNVAVIAAAGVAHLLASPIPDIVVGVAVSGLFIKSAVSIARESIGILRSPDGVKEEKAETQAKQKRAPKIAPSLKKILSSVFNRKAANTGKTPVVPPSPPAPEKKADAHKHNH